MPQVTPDFSDLNTSGAEVKIVYLLPNITLLSQPMDRGAVFTVKACYLGKDNKSYPRNRPCRPIGL
jgi:hypothetical protein